MMAHLFIAATITTCVAAANDELAQLALPLYQMEKAIEYRRLDNGLEVRLLPLAQRQSVAIASQFAVGSRNESLGQTGYAHLFEHMLFKGSQNAPGDSYSQTMSALSGRFNASTFFDYTNYYLNLPSNALELALWLEADRFIRPSLTTDTVKNQQQTVLEEMATTIDNQPYIRPAMEFLLKQVQETPYGHAVIGSKADIEQATPERLNQFHQAYYRPDAMQLSIVGDIPNSTNKWIDDNFGQWLPPTHSQPRFTSLKVNRETVTAEIVDERGPWPGLLLAWHTVGKTHQDAAALELVEAYLLQSRASLLAQSSLVDSDQLFYYSVPLTMEQFGVMNLVMVPRAHVSLNQLSQNITALIDQLANHSVDDATLTQLKRDWLQRQLSRLDNDLNLAMSLSATLEQDRLSPLTGPWERIQAVSNQDLQRVAKTYLQAGYVRLDLLPPWYIRWSKALLEFLPSGLTQSIEEQVL
ncbi:M16 family metallopeptidase [Shewanella colwelliana]|uniref:M16 family metallopeptidase n=1 Tax=Shewanella colwelliana TaxID=23 RepID=UPI0039C8B1A8